MAVRKNIIYPHKQRSSSSLSVFFVPVPYTEEISSGKQTNG
ncbi:hypothetical protein GLE_5382 [Lysobacter enzymogenes]|uniref:Uncharacterized protein n=1 Tax=Lysobacter enzymogenes TaxID=69 RepID=A0A0S2DQF6_LYSEN|nr:hypothetical protein GLE_5382 [Lysobacter enzymogenes]